MRLFGHPLHPALVAFPLGLLLLVPVWDLAAPFIGARDAATVAYWCELAGLILGGLAATAGLIDLVRLSKPAAMPTALRHAGCALLSLSSFGVAFALRGHGDPLRAVVVGLDLLGALALAFAGWLGGHLVFHYSVGVDSASSADAKEAAPPAG
ncbi:MAG TPA: DUF2231 domain-containing protein [Polyangiaceae bacterium]|jgi:uncharacterized membrane protein|nr:DUF2231 domain-containing protein [Polyangiaceae bacterium]